MAKRYRNIEAVARAWAEGDAPAGTSGNSAEFKGETLLSYGTPVARLVTDLMGDRKALVSSNRWSDSTTRLQNLGQAAADKAGLQVFGVPRLGTGQEDVTANLHYLQAVIVDAIRAFTNCRTASVPHHRAKVARAIEAAELYAFRFQPGRKTWKWEGLRAEHLQHKSEA